MKKISLILVVFSFFGCQNDVKFNDEYYQGLKDGVLWQTTNKTATVDNVGKFTLTGYVNQETLVLKTESVQKGSYVLGTTNFSNFSTFTSSDKKQYSTRLIAGTSPVSTIKLLNTGNGYSVSSNVATTNISGTGTGLKVDILKTTSDGAIVSVSINSSGNGYAAGDVVILQKTGTTGLATLVIQNINSNGEVVITDYSHGTVSGTFKLNLTNATNTEVVNFQYGKFYKIPVVKIP